MRTEAIKPYDTNKMVGKKHMQTNKEKIVRELVDRFERYICNGCLGEEYGCRVCVAIESFERDCREVLEKYDK